MIASLLAAALWVGPALSGSWFTPERNGEGFTLQVLDDGTAHALWFTYPPPGSAAQQAWIYASGGRIEGDRIRFEGAFTTRGPRFGAQYDPSQLQLIPWGSLEFRFSGCNEGEVTYAGPQAWGSGTRRLARLTALAELECSGKRHLNAQGARSLQGLRNRSGAWFDPSHNGEGWNVEELPGGGAQVYWFTYDERGEQAWTIGISPVAGEQMTIEQNLRPVGARFGNAFDPAQVSLTPWGRLQLSLTGCNHGSASWQSPIAAFGSGTLAPMRLTTPAGTACVEGTPSVPSNATWSSGAPEPQPAVSESANAVVGDSIYMAGGFGDTRGFKRYDASRNQWTVLPQTPAGRDHGLAAAYDGAIYVAGGNHNGGGDHSFNGWRYLIAENRWENLAGIPSVTQAGAATLGGYVWFTSFNGGLQQFNPRTGQAQTIPPDGNGTPRDHSLLVPFQGELWLIGGRQLGVRETARVAIYDPASQTWRAGPLLRTPRAGFAVAASPTILIVAGGEVLSGTFGVLGSVEAIAAGENAWSLLPNLPTPLHGFGALIVGNAFFTVGGTVIPGAVSNAGIVQVLRW
ncbi:MAG TPA: hypothetical protein VEC19_01845 [Usitatibacter sp.]|nr:hypothetical protein [Usitatibacter sp.]